MIILVTGVPRVGKSTIIDKLIKSSFASTPWVIAKEVRHEGERVGFEAINSLGHERIISHKTDIKSETKVGNYKVDTSAIDEIYCEILRQPGLKIVDEIGNMQLSSDAFTNAIDRVLKSAKKTQLIATINIKDKRLRRYGSCNDFLILKATMTNRDLLPDLITNIESKLHFIDCLSSNQFRVFKILLTSYLSKAKSIQLGKLLDNALPYIAKNKVHMLKRGTYNVSGNHDKHKVVRRFNRLSCDCDLFNGTGIYKNEPGECSHAQAVKIYSVSPATAE